MFHQIIITQILEHPYRDIFFPIPFFIRVLPQKDCNIFLIKQLPETDRKTDTLENMITVHKEDLGACLGIYIESNQ